MYVIENIPKISCKKFLNVLSVSPVKKQFCRRSVHVFMKSDLKLLRKPADSLFVPAPLWCGRTPKLKTLRPWTAGTSHGLVACNKFVRIEDRTFCSQNERQTRPNVGTRLIEASPSSIRPYLQLTRIDKPTGTFLLLWPSLWSICLSADPGCWPSGTYIGLFTLGAFLMRGAGCTINDMWDKDIDAKVERTKQRPLATGTIDRTDALGFLALQLGCATVVLLQLDWFSIMLGFSSVALVISYPLAKRYTNWPQLVLGLTFNWGVLLGWSAAHGASDWFHVLPLYAASVSWTLVYDTIYAHQDKRDDVRVGVKSTALLFGDTSKKWLSVFGCSMTGCLLVTGVLHDQTWPFFTSVGLVGAHLAFQIATLDISSPENCAKRFQSNALLGLILFVGILTGNLLRTDKNSNKAAEAQL